MKHLNYGILEDYEIQRNVPMRLCGVQFGDDEVLMGLVDRLIDDANAAGANVGLAVVQPGAAGHAKALSEQDGMYTVFVRGEKEDGQIQREQVVQSVMKAMDPVADDAALMALARDGGIRFAILNTDAVGEFALRDAVCAALAARFLVERWRAKLDGMALIVCGESADCADGVRREILALAREWRAGEDFERWLSGCRFFPALADALVFRSTAEEALRLCNQMNYADGMIHIAEPYGLWAIQADAAFRAEFPLDKCGQVQFVPDLTPALQKKHRIFDAGLFALSALGSLHGNDTLADCMKDEPLRDLVGHALMDEILPYAPYGRDVLIPYIITCYERYGNPLNDNRLCLAGRGLIHKFNAGILPVMREYVRENYEPPKNLTMALAATILLYADVRPKDDGYQTVVGESELEVHESPEILSAFSRLSSDMAPDSLVYAVLSDRSLWNGADLRALDGLEDALISNITG